MKSSTVIKPYSMNIELNNTGLATKALKALNKQCGEDPKLAHDVGIHLIINTEQRIGIKNDHIPRIIPLHHGKMKTYSELKILLICKDPSNFYRDALIADDSTSELFKEVIGLKKLRQRYKGKKLKTLFDEFDVVVADYRVHHLLPNILGATFYQSNKKLPFVIRMSKQIKEKGSKMKEECDVKYIKAQVRSICKNTWYVPNKDNCLSVKIGEIGVHPIGEVVSNAEDVLNFLCDKRKKPQGGCIKDGKISSLFVKTSNSVSLPIWHKPLMEEADDDEDIKL